MERFAGSSPIRRMTNFQIQAMLADQGQPKNSRGSLAWLAADLQIAAKCLSPLGHVPAAAAHSRGFRIETGAIVGNFDTKTRSSHQERHFAFETELRRLAVTHGITDRLLQNTQYMQRARRVESLELRNVINHPLDTNS